MKLLVESMPDKSWAYSEIIKWLLEIRNTWNINGKNVHTYEDIRFSFKKGEVLKFIEDTFENPNAPKKENEKIDIPKWDCYDVVYIGKGDVIKISQGREFYVFHKGVSLTFYNPDSPMLAELLTTYREDFVVKGRNFYSHETQLLDVAKKTRKKFAPPAEKFFGVW